MEFSVIPSNVALNQAFKSDLKAFLEIDPEKYQQLREVVGRGRAMDEAALQEVQKILGGKREESMRVGYMMSFLLGRVVASEHSVEDLLSDLKKITSIELEDDRRKVLADSLAPTPDEKKYDASSAAFAFGETYLGAAFFPIFAFGIGEKANTLFAGFGWTITYQDPGGERQAITINISTSEIQELIAHMTRSVEEAEAKLRSIQGGAA